MTALSVLLNTRVPSFRASCVCQLRVFSDTDGVYQWFFFFSPPPPPPPALVTRDFLEYDVCISVLLGDLSNITAVLSLSLSHTHTHTCMHMCAPPPKTLSVTPLTPPPHTHTHWYLCKQEYIHAHTDLCNLCLLHMSVSLQQNYITSVHLTQQKLDVQPRNFTKQTSSCNFFNKVVK